MSLTTLQCATSFSNDNLSGIWRYMITENSNFPAEDLENWITFPTNQIDNATRANLFQDCYLADLDNYTLGDLKYIAGRTNTYSTANATFSDFNQFLPVWDNGSYAFNDSNASHLYLWLQDQAGNIFGYRQSLAYELPQGDGSYSNPLLVYNSADLQAIGDNASSLSAHIN